MNPRRNRTSRSRKSASRARRVPRRANQPDAGFNEEQFLRRLAHANLFWTDCPNKTCRRVRNCAGPKPCFGDRWTAMPEWQRQWRRDWIAEIYRTRDFDKAVAYANARAAERDKALRIAGAHKAGEVA